MFPCWKWLDWDWLMCSAEKNWKPKAYYGPKERVCFFNPKGSGVFGTGSENGITKKGPNGITRLGGLTSGNPPCSYAGGRSDLALFVSRILLLPWKLTWNPKMEVWKMIFLFKGVIFRFHVSFRGSKWILTLFDFDDLELPDMTIPILPDSSPLRESCC